MKRLGLILGIVLALILVPLARPNIAGADGVSMFITGGGFSPCTNQYGGMPEPLGICPLGPDGQDKGQHFAFSASQDLTGTASGHAVFWYVDPFVLPNKKLLQIQGTVTCVLAIGTNGQTGGTGTITMHVDKVSGDQASSNQGLVGSYLTWGVQDNGPPSNSNPAYPDKISDLHSAANQDDCSGYTPDQPVNYGNITVGVQMPMLADPMTDNTTYNIPSTSDVYFNDGSGWQLAL